MANLIPRESLKNQPVYCETLQAGDAVNTYLSEPINSYSNIFIFIAAAICFAMLWQKKSSLTKVRFNWLLIGWFGLLLNAIGSWLWHSTKDTSWLPLDVFPAIIFLMILVYYWFQQLFTKKANVLLATLAMFFTPIIWIFLAVFVLGLRNTLWMPIGFTLTMLGLFLYFMSLTWHRLPKKNLFQGLQALIAMVLAATFRGIDIPVCHSIPFGTHFLWHLGLSVAAVLGLRFILGLQGLQRNNVR